MPPHTYTAAISPRLLYLLTALAVASVVIWTSFAGAGQPEAQCKGNSPKKSCPTLLPTDGASVSGTVTVSAQPDEPATSMTFTVDDVPLGPPDTSAPYEAQWDTTRSSNGTHALEVTALDAAGKGAIREHNVDVSNATAPPPPPADTTSPSVGLTSPAAGATISGSVSVSADASDNVAVVGVQFKVDGANLGAEDTSAPYSSNWTTSSVANGSHTVTALARDAAGNTSSSQRSVTVSNTSTSPPPPAGDTTAPTVALTSPAAGATVSGAVSIAANASDNVGVVGVQFKIDGGNLGAEDTTAPYAVSWSSGNVPNGTHNVTAVARDASGNTSSSQRNVTVSNTSTSPPPPAGDTTAPTVALTSPAAGATVSGAVSVAANASDNVGVVGVQFKIDGGNLGAEDTTAPYSVSWSSGNVPNGTHNVTAVARDASGNTSSSLRSVTVSNDTISPTVGLTNPASGATVSGAVSIAANASDNVGVVGVQFKIDGGNLGAEDTTAPYSVSWSSGNVADGAHNVTAVARDAAGNTANSQRTVTVSNSSGSGSGPALTWAPPALSNAVSINVTNANRRLFLDNARDYRLHITERLKRELWIEGGRNVVVVGGQITIDELGTASSYQDNIAIKVRFGDPSGTVHLEGILIDGPYVLDGIGIATGRNVQIENVRVERAHDGVKGDHADCIQIQQGVGHLRLDGFTCTTDRQGIFLGDHDGAIRSADLRRVNMYGSPGKHLFWQTNPSYPVTLTNFWLAVASGYTPWAPFGYWPYPQQDGLTWDGKTDLTRRTQLSADGTYLTFVGSTNTITGRINKGGPSGWGLRHPSRRRCRVPLARLLARTASPGTPSRTGGRTEDASAVRRLGTLDDEVVHDENVHVRPQEAVERLLRACTRSARSR